MKPVLKILFSIPILASVFSCNSPGRYTKEISLVDSINIILSSADSLLRSVDTAGMEKISLTISAELKIINEKSSDTLSKDDAVLFDNYNGVEVVLEKSYSMIFVLLKNLKYSQLQVANLLGDLKKNIAEETKVKSIIEKERESAEKIHESSIVLSSAVKENGLLFDSLNARVKSYIQALK